MKPCPVFFLGGCVCDRWRRPSLPRGRSPRARCGPDHSGAGAHACIRSCCQMSSQCSTLLSTKKEKKRNKEWGASSLRPRSCQSLPCLKPRTALAGAHIVGAAGPPRECHPAAEEQGGSLHSLLYSRAHHSTLDTGTRWFAASVGAPVSCTAQSLEVHWSLHWWGHVCGQDVLPVPVPPSCVVQTRARVAAEVEHGGGGQDPGSAHRVYHAAQRSPHGEPATGRCLWGPFCCCCFDLWRQGGVPRLLLLPGGACRVPPCHKADHASNVPTPRVLCALVAEALRSAPVLLMVSGRRKRWEQDGGHGWGSARPSAACTRRGRWTSGGCRWTSQGTCRAAREVGLCAAPCPPTRHAGHGARGISWTTM